MTVITGCNHDTQLQLTGRARS